MSRISISSWFSNIYSGRSKLSIKFRPITNPGKAKGNDLLGRFREIVSDPLNIAIKRDSRSGTVEDNFVYLHNGLKVPCFGAKAYYEGFSSILIINRGVHEPLEEYVFQEVIKKLNAAPKMLELGAYWGHYSMWLKLVRPQAAVYLVEPSSKRIKAGKENFKFNGFNGEFIQASVATGLFEVDEFLAEYNIEKLTILHSDIQGNEVEMLKGCVKSLELQCIDYLFISTHSQDLHQEVIDILEHFNYRIEISSDVDSETTSYDGFILSSSNLVERIFTVESKSIKHTRMNYSTIYPIYLNKSLTTFSSQK